MNSEIADDVAKAGPPAAIAGMNIFGVPLSELVLILTGIYMIALICVTIRKFLFYHRLGDKSTGCPVECPVAKRLIDGGGLPERADERPQD